VELNHHFFLNFEIPYKLIRSFIFWRALGMHAWLGFIAGALFVFAALLIFAASVGVAYYGLALQLEAVLAGVLLVMAGIAAWLFYVGIKAQHNRVKTGKEALIGAVGVATTDLTPKGEVRVLGEFWQALAKDTEIAKCQEIVVVDLDGMFLVVKATEEKLNSPKCS
jgi:membrane-bound ClpP family serine protease